MIETRSGTWAETAAREREPTLCGLVLAGGQGRRLSDYVTKLRGDSLPKQYVSFTGSRSMIETTFRRVERLIPRERVFTVVDRSHLSYPSAMHQLSQRRPGTLIIQPQNRDTGPGLMLPLIYIQKRHANAVVAVFPSDQYVRDEDRLMRHVRLAWVIVRRHPGKLVILGVEPEYEEPEYGYILPSAARDITGWGTHNVGRFVEKPGTGLARDLIASGALWNTLMMVFHANTLLEWMGEVMPELSRRFEALRAAIGTTLESEALHQVYDDLKAVNFSRDFVEPWVRRRPGAVAVLPVNQVGWSDWGSERRIADTLLRLKHTSAPVTAPSRNPPALRAGNAESTLIPRRTLR